MLDVERGVDVDVVRETLDEPPGYRPSVALDDADRDVAAEVGLGVAFVQHAVGLAGAGGHAEEGLVTARQGRRLCPAQAVSDEVDADERRDPAVDAVDEQVAGLEEHRNEKSR
jgi:hypothetical protein